MLSACSEFVCGATNRYILSSGTSYSAPLVAGAAAVVESSLEGNQSAAELQACILSGADRIDGLRVSPFYGRGRLNVLGAVFEEIEMEDGEFEGDLCEPDDLVADDDDGDDGEDDGDAGEG